MGAGRGRALDTSSVPLNSPRAARQLHLCPSGKERANSLSGLDSRCAAVPGMLSFSRAPGTAGDSSTSLGPARAAPPSGASCSTSRCSHHPSPTPAPCKHQVLFKFFLWPKADGQNITPWSLKSSYQIYLSCFESSGYPLSSQMPGLGLFPCRNLLGCQP